MFNIDIEVCGRCGGSVKVIADASDRCIEDQDIIDRILAHLRKKEQDIPTLPLLAPPSRAPVHGELLIHALNQRVSCSAPVRKFGQENYLRFFDLL